MRIRTPSILYRPGPLDFIIILLRKCVKLLRPYTLYCYIAIYDIKMNIIIYYIFCNS